MPRVSGLVVKRQPRRRRHPYFRNKVKANEDEGQLEELRLNWLDKRVDLGEMREGLMTRVLDKVIVTGTRKIRRSNTEMLERL
jgi:hypothetical protein